MEGTVIPDAESPELAARLSGVCRAILYRAMDPDPAKRNGMPHLRSFKIGGSRRILRETRLRWLADLEAAGAADFPVEAGDAQVR